MRKTYKRYSLKVSEDYVRIQQVPTGSKASASGSASKSALPLEVSLNTETTHLDVSLHHVPRKPFLHYSFVEFMVYVVH